MSGPPDMPADSLQASVIVPVYKQWNLVPALLAALIAQDLPASRFEILIVNNDAPAPPPPLELPANARVLPCAAPGSYAARNTGAAEARGDWLVFTDADCRPLPSWLAALTGAAGDAATGDAATGLRTGPVEMVLPPTPTAFAIYDFVRGIPQARYVARGYATTANLAVPARLFRTIGGFDARRRSGGDAEFCRRAGAAGYGLVLVSGAVTTHPCRTSWEELAIKARRIKGGQIRAGPARRRLAWTLRSLCPPVRDVGHSLASPYPLRYRLIALGVRLRVWGVELAEVARLLSGGAPERR
jgi:cellulose synthase/poly-beta-1,6-N-acetylglucosamine synthase-like glycosyltransferase